MSRRPKGRGLRRWKWRRSGRRSRRWKLRRCEGWKRRRSGRRSRRWKRRRRESDGRGQRRRRWLGQRLDGRVVRDPELARGERLNVQTNAKVKLPVVVSDFFAPVVHAAVPCPITDCEDRGQVEARRAPLRGRVLCVPPHLDDVVPGVEPHMNAH